MSKKSRTILAFIVTLIVFTVFNSVVMSDEYGTVGAIVGTLIAYVVISAFVGILWIVFEWIDRGQP